MYERLVAALSKIAHEKNGKRVAHTHRVQHVSGRAHSSVIPRLVLAVLLAAAFVAPESAAPASVLNDRVLVTWYGNPRSKRMGILGEQAPAERAAALRRQAAAYAPFSASPVLMAYHLVAVVATCTPGADDAWRRRETPDVIRSLLDEARANGFRLILDVQPGRSTVAGEVAALEPFLREPDVDLALDPEFALSDCQVPGRQIGHLDAADVNGAIQALETVITDRHLPPKVLIVHQFRLDMLRGKSEIRSSPVVDVVLDMDGFGTPSLKRATYRAVMREPLEHAGIKLFYRQDLGLFSPAEVMALVPRPSVVIYQ